MLLIVIGILAVAAHVVLGGAVLAAPQWTGWAADATVTVGYRANRRRKAAKSR